MVTRIVQTTEFVTIQGNAIKLGVRGFVRICIETCARGNVIGNTDSEKRAC